MGPTQAGFLAFLRDVAGIDVAYLPDNAPVIAYAYQVALSIVSQSLACSPWSGLPGSTNLYGLAVYNLGTDNVINFAPDQTGRTYFQELRKAYDIALFVPGVVAGSGDSGTSQSRLNPEFMKNFTMGDLQNLKTPFGRAYLNFAQQIGTLWGMN